MRCPGQSRRRRQCQIDASSTPRFAFGPFALALEAELEEQPTSFAPSLRKLGDPYLDMMKLRHVLQSLNPAYCLRRHS